MSVVTLRMRLLLESAMNRLPAPVYRDTPRTTEAQRKQQDRSHR